MVRYIIKRIILMIPVIIAVSLIVFTLIELAPGTVVDQMISGDMTPEDVAVLKAKYNLDKPMLYRYGLYMFNLIQGDLGVSQANGQDVFKTYMQRLPNTLILAFAAVIIGTTISIPMGVRAARRAGSVLDTATTTFTLIGISMPSFWLGLLLLWLFASRLGWLPGGGNRHGIRSLILPAICSAMSLTAICARQTRSSLLEILKADFLRTARAKGVPEKTVIRKHALGNALIPIITVIGTTICVQIAGSAVIEQVFAWPGVGRMLIEGVRSRDVTVILGCSLMTTILYVVVQLVVDLFYSFVDPRIKSQYMVRKQKKRYLETVMPKSETDTPSAVTSALESTNEDIITVNTAANFMEYDTKRNEAFSSPADVNTPEMEQSEKAGASYDDAQSFVTRRYENIANKEKKEISDGVILKYKRRGKTGEIWRRLIRNKSSLVGLIILCVVFMTFIFSLFMDLETTVASNIPARFSPPSWQFPFGTDNMGRNAFLQVIYGTRYSVVIGFGSVAISICIGVSLGSIAGYYGGNPENIIMRICDIMASIPSLLLGMVIMVVLGLKLQNLIIAVSVGGMPNFIRMSRASVLTVRGNEYVEAVRAVGFSDFRIIVTQVIPNALSPIIVQATAALGISIIVSASLSYLGFGVPAPAPEWGAIVSLSREFAYTAPWLMAFPGMAIMVTVVGFNLLGDGLRDALDPKQKGSRW